MSQAISNEQLAPQFLHHLHEFGTQTKPPKRIVLHLRTNDGKRMGKERIRQRTRAAYSFIDSKDWLRIRIQESSQRTSVAQINVEDMTRFATARLRTPLVFEEFGFDIKLWHTHIYKDEIKHTREGWHNNQWTNQHTSNNTESRSSCIKRAKKSKHIGSESTPCNV